MLEHPLVLLQSAGDGQLGSQDGQLLTKSVHPMSHKQDALVLKELASACRSEARNGYRHGSEEPASS